MDELWTIDFEASSLNLIISYPIEVGYTNGVIDREYLIRPYSGWSDWSEESATIHKIERHELIASGHDPYEVCKHMNDDLAGKNVWCDGGIYDQHWNFTLFDACGLTPKFRIMHYPPLDKIEEETEHRALADAKQLWKLIKKEQDDINNG